MTFEYRNRHSNLLATPEVYIDVSITYHFTTQCVDNQQHNGNIHALLMRWELLQTPWKITCQCVVKSNRKNFISRCTHWGKLCTCAEGNLQGNNICNRKKKSLHLKCRSVVELTIVLSSQNKLTTVMN